jgi:hypothetical protein
MPGTKPHVPEMHAFMAGYPGEHPPNQYATGYIAY